MSGAFHDDDFHPILAQSFLIRPVPQWLIELRCTYEQHLEKTCLQGFQPGATQTRTVQPQKRARGFF